MCGDGLADHAALHILERRVRSVGVIGGGTLGGRGRKGFGTYYGPVAHDDGLLDGVLQLAYVSHPAARGEAVGRGGGEGKALLAVFVGIARKEHLRQRHDILLTAAQRRQLYMYRIQTNLNKGIYVADVQSNSPASKAGIQAGDVITQFDGKDIESYKDFLTQLYSKNPGDTVKLTINRNGSTSSVNVTLGSS